MNERANSIAFGLLLMLSFAAGWAVNGWRTDSQIAKLEPGSDLSRAAADPTGRPRPS